MHNRAVMLAAFLAACAPAVPSPDGGATRTMLTATATVLAVDPAAETLLLRDAADGSEFIVTADDRAALQAVGRGDVIMLDYFESVALEMAAPDDPGAPVRLAEEAPTPVGAGPGGVAVESASLVAEFLGYDSVAGIARVRGPDGATRRLSVPPALAAFAAGLAPGDRVQVTVTEAVAVSVTPAD